MILPPLAPTEVINEQIFQGNTVEKMVKGPARRHMPNNKYPRTCSTKREIVQKPPDSLHSLSPTFPTWIRRIKIVLAITMQLGGWLPGTLWVQHAVITFAETPIIQDRRWRLRKGNLGGFNSPPEIGGEYGMNAISTPAHA